MTAKFTPFPKIPRFNREIIITEKIDGTNAGVHITPVAEGFHEMDDPTVISVVFDAEVSDQWFAVRASSRKRFIVPGDDNFGFAAWVHSHVQELVALGVGSHFGEWWGQGIQRGYGLDHKRFSLFNAGRWFRRIDDKEPEADGIVAAAAGQQFPPECCDVAPVLARLDGPSTVAVAGVVAALRLGGSVAAPGFMDPEGIVIFHAAANQLFKVTLEEDEKPKGLAA